MKKSVTNLCRLSALLALMMTLSGCYVGAGVGYSADALVYYDTPTHYYRDSWYVHTAVPTVYVGHWVSRPWIWSSGILFVDHWRPKYRRHYVPRHDYHRPHYSAPSRPHRPRPPHYAPGRPHRPGPGYAAPGRPGGRPGGPAHVSPGRPGRPGGAGHVAPGRPGRPGGPAHVSPGGSGRPGRPEGRPGGRPGYVAPGRPGGGSGVRDGAPRAGSIQHYINNSGGSRGAGSVKPSPAPSGRPGGGGRGYAPSRSGGGSSVKSGGSRAGSIQHYMNNSGGSRGSGGARHGGGSPRPRGGRR